MATEMISRVDALQVVSAAADIPEALAALRRVDAVIVYGVDVSDPDTGKGADG